MKCYRCEEGHCSNCKQKLRDGDLNRIINFAPLSRQVDVVYPSSDTTIIRVPVIGVSVTVSGDIYYIAHSHDGLFQPIGGEDIFGYEIDGKQLQWDEELVKYSRRGTK